MLKQTFGKPTPQPIDILKKNCKLLHKSVEKSVALNLISNSYMQESYNVNNSF